MWMDGMGLDWVGLDGYHWSYWKLNNSYLSEEEYVAQIKYTLSKAVWELQTPEAEITLKGKR